MKSDKVLEVRMGTPAHQQGPSGPGGVPFPEMCGEAGMVDKT